MTESVGLKSELRKFGLALAALLLIFGGAIPYWRHGQLPLWACALAGALALIALVAPVTLAPLRGGWTMLGEVLGRVNTTLILGIFYFAILLPVALILRARGIDRMNRKLEPKLDTYRIPSKGPSAPEQFERIF